jgi:serine/threonine-protein kinase
MAALASLGAAAGAVYVGATFARRTAAGLPETPALPSSADRPSPPASLHVPGAARRHVSLAVSPKDVTVTVDDAGAAVHDGAVDIEGEAGSVRRVRASKGAAEVVADVTVTDGGAEPPRLDLGAAVTTGAPPRAPPVTMGDPQRVPQAPPVIATPPETPRPPGPRAGASPSAAHSAHGPTKPLIPDRFE